MGIVDDVLENGFTETKLVMVIGFSFFLLGVILLVVFLLRIRRLLGKNDVKSIRDESSRIKRQLLNILLQLLVDRVHKEEKIKKVMKSVEDNDIKKLEEYDWGSL